MATDEILTVTVPRSMLEAVLRRMTMQRAKLADEGLVTRFVRDVRNILAVPVTAPAPLPPFPHGPLVAPQDRETFQAATRASGYDPLWRKR